MSSGAEDGVVSRTVEDVLIGAIIAWAATVFVGLPALVVFGLGRAIGAW